MRNCKWLAVAGLLLCGAGSVRAQSQNLTAHRLYFSALAGNLGPNGEETPALEAYLNDAKVSKAEHGKAAAALAVYKKHFNALIESYNNSPATLAGRNDDTAVFLIQRELLVQNVIDLFKLSLSDVSGIEERVNFWGEKNHVNDLSESSELSPTHPHLMPIQFQMGPHYNYYHVQSTSTDANGNMTAYTTAELQGYANCGGCSFFHTGKVYNSLGGGGWINGPTVTPPTYMNVQNPQQFTFGSSCFGDNGPVCSSENWNEIVDVTCTSGWQWSSSFKWTIEAAITFSQVTGWNGSEAFLQDWCQLQYEPPDYNPGVLLNAQQGATYVLGGAICFNSTWSSGFWLCSPGIATSLTGTYTRKYCTHNIPPY